MNINYNNFIGFYRNVFPDDFCNHVIEQFELSMSQGIGYNRQQSENSPKHEKDDFAMCIYGNCDIDNFRYPSYETESGRESVRKMFFIGLQRCYEHYVENFSILKKHPIISNSMKIQKTQPGGGYHVWHYEHSTTAESRSRVLTYILYLNSLKNEEAGETEFLYQQLRVQPEENLLVIWPADWTYTHKGNVVYGSKSKYIVTGWFNYEK